MKFSRRRALLSATGGAFITVAPGARDAASETLPVRDTIVVVFMRGGADGLQMVAPAGDRDYIANRPNIRLPTSGSNAGLGIGTLDGVDFFLHYAAPELKKLYDQGSLAVVHAAGLKFGDRSHFKGQSQMERGAGDDENAPSDGWMARHLMLLPDARAPLAAVAIGTNYTEALLGYSEALALANLQSLGVEGGITSTSIIRALNSGTSGYARTAHRALNAISEVQNGLKRLEGASTAQGYTGSPFSQALRNVALLMKMGVHVEAAHIDMGNWDHHGNIYSDFYLLTYDLSRSLDAFWNEMAEFRGRLTIITMTEFGRRVRENANGGTDHGTGSFMFLLGGSVNGGRIFGSWPGLAANQLWYGDLDITTDYRRIVGEVLAKRHGARQLSKIFPSISYDPLGIVTGDDSGVT